MSETFIRYRCRCFGLATQALAMLLATAAYSGTVAADSSYRCTDENGLVLLTADTAAARICGLLSASGNKCDGKQCSFTITKDEGGHLYLNGTTKGTRVRYPIDARAGAVTICIRDQCKVQ